MTRAAPLTADSPATDGGPVVGELVSVDAITPSADARRADAKGRLGNTAVQVGVPTAVVIIGTWLAGLCHIDLDRGPGTDMPTEVSGAWIAILTFAMAYRMNRTNLRAVDDDQDEGQALLWAIVGALAAIVLLALFGRLAL